MRPHEPVRRIVPVALSEHVPDALPENCARESMETIRSLPLNRSVPPVIDSVTVSPPDVATPHPRCSTLTASPAAVPVIGKQLPGPLMTTRRPPSSRVHDWERVELGGLEPSEHVPDSVSVPANCPEKSTSDPQATSEAARSGQRIRVFMAATNHIRPRYWH